MILNKLIRIEEGTFKGILIDIFVWKGFNNWFRRLHNIKIKGLSKNQNRKTIKLIRACIFFSRPFTYLCLLLSLFQYFKVKYKIKIIKSALVSLNKKYDIK